MNNKKQYVIDTHILLWLMFSPEKISRPILDILENTENSIHISSISFWEISIKYHLGKLELNDYTPDELPSIAQEMDIDILEINHSILASFYQLPTVNKHKDPFDRVVIWQCITEGYVLLSVDGKFSDYKDFGLCLS